MSSFAAGINSQVIDERPRCQHPHPHPKRAGPCNQVLLDSATRPWQQTCRRCGQVTRRDR